MCDAQAPINPGKEYPHLDYIAILNIGGKRVGFRTIHDHVDVSEVAGQYGGGEACESIWMLVEQGGVSNACIGHVPLRAMRRCTQKSL